MKILKTIYIAILCSLLTILLPLHRSYGNGLSEKIIDDLHLSYLNEDQKKILHEEISIYEKQINALYEKDKEEYKKKINDLITKLAHGFKVYNLTTDNKVLQESLESFIGETKMMAYVSSYVEGAFLNNLFQRLADLKYKVKANKCIEIRVKFKKISEASEEDKFTFRSDVVASEKAKEALKEALKKKQKDDAVLNSLFASTSERTITLYKESTELEITSQVEDILKRFGDLSVSDIDESEFLECIKFCNMCNAERAARLMSSRMRTIGGIGKYLISKHDEKYIFYGTIDLGDDVKIELEQEFINDSRYFNDYADYLMVWGVDGDLYNLIKYDYPKTKASDYLPFTDDNNNCFTHCINHQEKEMYPAAKLLAEILTAPYTAPGKIIYNKNFIFEDEEVTKLDRGLAFLDVPGLGTLTKTIAIKFGIKVVVIAGVARILSTTDVINDIINRSGVADAVKAMAKNALNNLDKTKRVFVFKGLTDKIIKVDEIPDFINVINRTASGKWSDIVEGWSKVVKGADELAAFVNKSLAQKLDEIATIWKTKYPIPDMLGGRSFFEDMMGHYRYTKSSGWHHTGDISFNVKGIDFYKGTQQGSEIFANTAVSMKTTIKTNVDEWLQYKSVQDNIKFLKEGLSPIGLIDSNNSLKMFISNAEIHIYMPKANISEALKSTWMSKLNNIDPRIKFEIKAIEDFIK